MMKKKSIIQLFYYCSGIKITPAVLFIVINIIAVLSCTTFAQAPLSRVYPHVVVLADQSLIPCMVEQLGSHQLVIQRSEKPKSLTIPLEYVAGIIFTRLVPSDAEDALIFEILDTTSPADQVILNNRKTVQGSIDSIDYFDLTLKNTSQKKTVVPLGSVKALSFAPALRKGGPNDHIKQKELVSNTIVAGSDGLILYGSTTVNDTININSISSTKSHTQTTGRVVIPSTSESAEEAVLWLDVPWSKTPIGFDRQNVSVLDNRPLAWLDAIKPEQAKQQPFWSLINKYSVNKTSNHARLVSNTGEIYLRGFFVTASSRLTFALGKPHQNRILTGIVARPKGIRFGTVEFQILLDSRQVQTWTLSSTDPPKPFSVNIGNASRLDLLVDFADDSPVHDEAIWGNVRFIEKSVPPEG